MYGPIFSMGLCRLCPKNILTAPKNCYANLQNCFADSPHPIIISKIPDFGHFLSLFNKYWVLQKNFTFGCWLLPEKFSICPKK